MENDSQLYEYLKRIKVPRPTDGPNEDYLIQLHIGHLTCIPFEAFDLIDTKELNISLDYVFDRIVRQHRGGVCYQMNGLFAAVLKQLNYIVQLIPCSVYNLETNSYLDPKSHAAILVTLNNNVQLLCDVGFSRNFLTPLFFRTDCVQYGTNGFYRLTIIDKGSRYKLERGYINSDDEFSLPSSLWPRTQIVDIDPERIKWIISYSFAADFFTKTTRLDDFKETCPYIVHSPEVILNYCTICFIQTFKPVVGSHGIIGKEYWRWTCINGKETRENHLISPIELEELLRTIFHLPTIGRKIELVDRRLQP